MLTCFEPFVAYWQKLREDAFLPSREAFHPARVKDFIGRVAIVERRDDGYFVARLVGTELVARLGHEHTGEDFLDVMQTPEGRAENLALYNAVLDQPCGVWGERDMITDKGVYHTQFLILPVRHQATGGDEFFAVFDFDRSLPTLGGVHFERFGVLRREVILDIGAGLPEAFANLPHERLQLH